MRCHRFVILAALLVIVASAPASAQEQVRRNVISANPFGLLLEWFNGEYERAVAETGSVGFGGSFFTTDDDEYVNADVFYRHYPQGRPFDGWAFGVKVGLTSVDGSGTYFGYGFDANRSWLLGSSNTFYVGIGFGLKRLVGVPDEDDLIGFIPTIRVVNIGFAF